MNTKEAFELVLGMAELGSMDHRDAKESPEEFGRQCDAIQTVERIAESKPLTRAEIVNGTGFARDARFIMVPA